MNFQPIQPLWTELPTLQEETKQEAGGQSTLFSDVFQAAIQNVRDTETAKNEAEYRLATGQLDNPAEWSIANSQWSMSVNLLIQMRNRALDAYSELMRISM